MDIQKQMFIANGVHRIAKSDTWEYLTGLKVLLKLNKQNPLDSGKWANGLHSVHAGVRAAPKIPSGQLPNEAALLDKVLSWIGDLHPGAMVIADDVRESLQRDSSVRAMIENESGRAAFARSFVYNNVAPEASAILGEIYDITQQNSQVKSIWDSLMARDLGSISATPDQIVMENPELAGLLTIIGKTPDVEVSLNFVKNMVESLTSELGSNSDKIELLNGQVHSASTALETLVGEAAAGKLMQEESIRQKTREDALRGAVALYGLFGGDTQTVRRLNAVLNAYTGTRSAVDAYNAAILAKSGQAAASLALAGAWVGVALTLAAAFSEDEGKSAEQQVLDAIGNLSKQLTDIQTQISQSFKYIDDRLTILSRDMAIGFDAVLTGIQANRFHLRELLSASYGLAVQLDTSTTLLVNKLDYAIEVLAYEPVSKFVNWKRVTGRPLKPEQVDEAAAAVTSLANRSLDQMNAGVELQDLDTTFDTWLQSRSTVNLQSWSSNINTLLSICRLLGIDLPARRGPNPQIWSLASIACMEIGANNSDPPSQLGIQLLPKLIEHGSYLVDSTARLRQTIFNAPTGAEVLFAFLIKKYEAAVNDVITAVEETHAKKLALAHVDSPNLKALPEFLELLAEAESVAGLVFDDTLIVTAADNRLLPWKAATPSSEHNAIMPLPRHARGEQPVGTEEGWMGSRLDDLVPSVYDCKSWPTVSGAEAWKAFPLEVSAHAIAGSWLGLGKVSIEYQAQIEQWYWEGDSLLGIPIVYYILLLSSTQRRTAISAASRYIADSHLGPIRCFASGSLLKVGTIGLKQNFDRSRGTVALLPTESYENFIRPNQLFDEVRSCYATIASQIWEEFSDDLSSTVSNLGCRVAMLDRVTGLIRIVAQWLVPDRVATDARLRASLYDRAHLLTPRSPGVTLANALKKDPDLIVPLLDSQILINMILLREGQEKHDAEAWSTDQLLGSLADWRDASSSALVRSVRIRQAADLEGSAVPHIANLVEELRLHQRYFPVPS